MYSGILMQLSSVSGLASVRLKELTPLTRSVMRKGSVHAKGMSSAASAHSVTLATMVCRVLTHMGVDSASVMATAVCVEKPMVILEGTFQTNSRQVWKAGLL